MTCDRVCVCVCGARALRSLNVIYELYDDQRQLLAKTIFRHPKVFGTLRPPILVRFVFCLYPNTNASRLMEAAHISILARLLFFCRPRIAKSRAFARAGGTLRTTRSAKTLPFPSVSSTVPPKLAAKRKSFCSTRAQLDVCVCACVRSRSCEHYSIVFLCQKSIFRQMSADVSIER